MLQWLRNGWLWFFVALLPVARVMYYLLAGELVNPIEFMTRSSGTWALVFLLLTLAMTPLRQITAWAGWLQYRRMLGLYAFFYACLHVVLYLWLDQFFVWAAIWADIIKRPFITVGFLAFVMLIPLALTSTKAMMRRLKRRWGLLHRLIYPIALLAVVHYLWLVKKDLTEPLIYGAVLLLLLAWRLRPWLARITAYTPPEETK